MDSEPILACEITRGNRNACVSQILSWIETPAPEPRFAFCVNPHSIVTARRDPEFADALRGADLRVPDGVGMIWASRILGGGIRTRVTGSDLFDGTMAGLHNSGGSCFLLGAAPETLDLMTKRMSREYPSVRIAGRFSPSFAETFTAEEDDAMVSAVNAAAPDVLWVGMTQPKQEKWVWRNRDRLRAGVVIPIGAVFDFYTGRVLRPGSATQRLGLEWFVRLSREPRRLWRRNLDSPLFLWLVLLDRLSRRNRR
jgi:N-acetylglucosaminyldiphosphoundecaprenol N-acetyl-beta-D-mannosaminyltransferase